MAFEIYLFLTEEGPSVFEFEAAGGVEVSGEATVAEGALFTASGGVHVSGSAEIDGNPFYHDASGGVLVAGEALVIIPFVYTATGGVGGSGTATVVAKKVTLFQYFPRGGVRVSGVASQVFKFTRFKPSGGLLISGEAAVRYIAPFFFASGGARIGGAAEVSSITIFDFDPSGGVLVSGAAAVTSAFVFVPSGGVRTNGAAGVVIKQPVFVPSGGIRVSGLAQAIYLPSGAVLTPENPLADVFTGWAMNYDTLAATRYEDLPLTSMCRFKGKTYGTNAAGIYELGADTDAGQPIKASITTAKSDFNEKVNKRVPYVYLGYKSDMNMRVSVVTNKRSASYYDLQKPESGNRGSRAIIGRGLDGLYWSFRVENKEGAFFELDMMKIEYTLLRKMGV